MVSCGACYVYSIFTLPLTMRLKRAPSLVEAAFFSAAVCPLHFRADEPLLARLLGHFFINILWHFRPCYCDTCICASIAIQWLCPNCKHFFPCYLGTSGFAIWQFCPCYCGTSGLAFGALLSMLLMHFRLCYYGG